MRVLLLGCLEAVGGDGVELELPAAPLVRAVLEALALRAGSVVQTSELIDTVWGEDPPATVRKCLQTYIGVLRRALGSSTIKTAGGGYRLQVDHEDVDLTRFERYIRDGSDRLDQGECSLAVERFSAALGLWRGAPLEELLDSPAGMAAPGPHLGTPPGARGTAVRGPTSLGSARRSGGRLGGRGPSRAVPGAALGAANAGPVPFGPPK
jgi:hypothetical protein